MQWAKLLIATALGAPLGACDGVPVRHLSVVTGPVGGTMYAISAAWADMVNSKLPLIQMTNQVAGGSAYTARVLGNHEADFALVSNDSAYYAYHGESIFEGNAQPEFRAVASLYSESFHVVVRKGSGITRIEDLVGRCTAVGPPGSGTLLNSRKVLETCGLTMEDIGAMQLGFVEAAEYLRDGHCDVAFYVTGLPYGPVVDITVSQDIDVFGLSQEVIERLTETYPFLIPTTVPAETYKGMAQPFRTVSVKMLLLTTDEMDGDIVYDGLEVLFENLDRLAAAHASGADITLEKALDGISIPLHEGAERFYRERGLVESLP
jgi:TRAP transporter TAXI family solute receptor